MNLSRAAEQLAQLLSERQARIVFAESCTAGLVSATLARVPGISQWHCGSAVTYRERTKQDWLGISADMIEKYNVVSESVAREMALGVLRITPEADLSASVTGHLGPDAPPELDGVVCIATAWRRGENIESPRIRRIRLAEQERLPRQEEATLEVLTAVTEALATLRED